MPNDPVETDLVSVVGVHVLSRYVVALDFDTGERRVLDLEPYLWGPMFAPIVADYATFCSVSIDGGTVAWPNGADLAPDELYSRAQPSVPD